MENKFKAGDKVYFKNDPYRATYQVYAVYSETKVSLGRLALPDTEQDNQTDIAELEAVRVIKRAGKPKFFRVRGVRGFAGSVYDRHGVLVDLKERHLDGDCPAEGKHWWLMLPLDATAQRDEQKEYLICLKCLLTSHL